MRQLLLFLACSALLLAAGCAVGGVTKEWAAKSPPSNAASITFFRPNDPVGSGLAARLLMDGFVVGAVGIGDRLTLRVPPGRHLTGLASAPITVDLAEGESQHYLVQLTPWTQSWNIQRLTEVEAAAWIVKSRDVGGQLLPASEMLPTSPAPR